MKDLGVEQEHATTIYEDNQAAIVMANSQRPTQQTRHLDIKHFGLLDWVETYQLKLSNYQQSS